MIWEDAVFNRSEDDINQKTNIAFCNLSTLKRIDNNIAFLATEFDICVQKNTFELAQGVTPNMLTILLQNITYFVNAYYVLPSTPAIPIMPLTHFQQFNDMEKILFDMYSLWYKNRKEKHFAGEVYCGQQIGVI